MPQLVNSKAYPPSLLDRVLSMSPTAREIANRWMQGWPKRVEYLIRTGVYLDALEEQTRKEEWAQSDPTLRHLSAWEKAAVHDIALAPPIPGDVLIEEDDSA